MLFGLLYKTFFGSKSKNGDSSSENLIENNVNESVGNVDENSVDMGSFNYNFNNLNLCVFSFCVKFSFEFE